MKNQAVKMCILNFDTRSGSISHGLRPAFSNQQSNADKKSKCFPRQTEVAQGLPGRLRPRIFLTFRHYKGGRSSAKRTGHLYPRKNPWYSLSEAESTSGHMVLSRVPRKKSPVTPPAIDLGTVRIVAQRLNHYATLAPSLILIILQKSPVSRRRPN